MYLSDNGILNAIKSKELSIEPFEEDKLSPNGYDTSIAVFSDSSFSTAIKDSGTYEAKPHELIYAKTKETFRIGSNYVSFAFLRSRYSRQGLLGNFVVIDAGFNSVIRGTIANLSNNSIGINLDEGVLHVVFAKLDSASLKPYGSTQKSHFQNQK